jgi:hypothetical protein
LFGAPSSQAFTMSTQAEPLAAERKPRQEAKETCLPVTIRAIEVALQQRGETGADLKFFDVVEPGMVIVVAAVESVVRQAASLEVVLNDATGRIKARYFVMDPRPDELERIVPGCYVSCFGEVRSAPVQHLAVKGMRPVDSPDEVSYHIIEAAHAALQLKKGRSGRAAEPETPAKKAAAADRLESSPPTDTLTPQKPVMNSHGAVSVAVDVAEPVAVPAAAAPEKIQTEVPQPAKGLPTGAELRAVLLGLLRDAAVGPEGLHVDAITEKVGAAASEVKSIVAELVDDGEVYNTITDEHFAAV